MTQEDKELLVSLLKGASENNMLEMYDDEETIYEVDWVFIDGKICIKIKPFQL